MGIRKNLKVNISKVVSLIRFSWKSEVGLPGCFVRKFVTNLVNIFAHNLVNITKLVTEIVTDFSHFPNKQNTNNVNIETGFSYSNIKYFKFSSITVDHLVLMNCLSSYFHNARAKEWAKASVTYCESGAGTDLPWEEARKA